MTPGSRPAPLVRDAEVVERRLGTVLCGEAGVGQKATLAVPFRQTAVAERLHLTLDDEGHHAAGEAFLEHDESADAAVTLCKANRYDKKK